ncbi:Kelch repeat-containing protein [Brumimicrobium mesophilum]|uniref:Kelch repeat-containing protein n=1 Tax=Brumimicrobium mesophilum TaxID=392717 RepID=UPI000D142C1A|nr:hypothetical protein [Brumimicrobium mesophilum]
MKQMLIVLIFITVSSLGIAQGDWTWTKVAPLPFATSNNAVVEAVVGNNKFMYSFGGITGSLTQSEIHKRVFKYDVSQDIWSEMDGVPDSTGKLASGASYVNGKIYLIGGYHVQINGTETSSNKVHIYNPQTDVFEADGSPIPIPIDDHVQAVWRDSLIYIITGWSNTGNIPDVQIYNPELNYWMMGSPTPNNSNFKSFGASGYILGDTIYYLGGVRDTPTFLANNILRKGVIDKNDPTQIEWSIVNSNNGEPLYRSACSAHDKTIFWIGGSKEAYNFDAITYYSNKPVVPNMRTFELDLENKSQNNYFSAQTQAMDLRGIAKLGGGNWMIAGGIDTLQQATTDTYLLHNPELSNIDKSTTPPFFKVEESNGYFKVMTENIGEIIVYDIQGRTLFKSNKNLADIKILKSDLQKGMLLFVYNDKTNLPILIKKINP